MNASVYNVYEARPRYDEEQDAHMWDVYCNNELQCTCEHWARAESIIVALQEDDMSHGQNPDVEG